MRVVVDCLAVMHSTRGQGGKKVAAVRCADCRPEIILSASGGIEGQAGRRKMQIGSGMDCRPDGEG